MGEVRVETGAALPQPGTRTQETEAAQRATAGRGAGSVMTEGVVLAAEAVGRMGGAVFVAVA